MTSNNGARMRWSQDEVKPGWCQDDTHTGQSLALWEWTVLIGTQRTSTWPPSPHSFCSVPLSLPIKTSASTEMCRWALRHESPIFLYISTCLSRTDFQSSKQTDLHSVTNTFVKLKKVLQKMLIKEVRHYCMAYHFSTFFVSDSVF